ncbi:MAG TPA: hypothetical protein VGZ72_22685 [Stellaceae bacterium]|jgi:hypothetical protein|nr:hypothetical protein [Stellaceae bacterium]
MWTLKNTIGFWVATGLALLAVLLVVVDGWLVTSNASIRDAVNGRQQYINQSAQLQRLYQELLNELGSLALKNNTAIRQLLAESGITIVGPAQPAAPAQAAPANSATVPNSTTVPNPATVPLKKP